MYQFTQSKTYLMTVAAFIFALISMSDCLATLNEDQVPNLVGTWTGENHTYAEKKGYSNWNKTVEISE